MAIRKEFEDGFERAFVDARGKASARDAYDALLDMGNLYFSCDSHGEAIRCYEEITRLNEREGFLTATEKQEVLIALATCLWKKGNLREASSLCGELLTRGDVNDPALEAKLRIIASWVELSNGNIPAAESLGSRARSLICALGDQELAARFLLLSGSISMRAGRWTEAQDMFEEALWVARKNGHKNLLADAHNNLGVMWKNRCAWLRAMEHLETALSIDREAGNYFKVAMRSANLGVVLLKSGRWQEAHDVLTESLGANRKIDRKAGIVRSLLALGNAKRLMGFLSESEALYVEALSLSRSSGLKREECLAKEFMGELLFEKGIPGKALDLLTTALEEAQGIAPDGDMVAEIERRRSEVLLSLERGPEAGVAGERALNCARRLGDTYEEGASLRVLAMVAAADGRTGEAGSLLELAIKILKGMDERYELAKCYYVAGKLTLQSDEPDEKEARRYLLTSLALFEGVGAQRLSERVQETMLTLRDNLLPESGNGRRMKLPPVSKPEIRWGMVSGEQSLVEVFSFIEKVADVPFPVLIEGETGTGKELVARAIHSQGRRSNGRLLTRNCTALPGALFESELFGSAKGAFTGAISDRKGLLEEADNGTLFLDEMGDLCGEIQVKLLRLLEDGEVTRLGDTRSRKVNVRVIAATGKNLEEEVRAGRFRSDLFYRLAALRIKLPPLRERREDIPHIVNSFLEKYSRMLGVGKPILSEKTMDMFLRYDWPGNVRELENAVKRVVTLCVSGAEAIQPDLFRDSPGPESTPGGQGSSVPLKTLMRKVEMGEIERALALANGNKSRTARMLGMDRKTLRKRLAEFQSGDSSISRRDGARPAS